MYMYIYFYSGTFKSQTWRQKIEITPSSTTITAIEGVFYRSDGYAGCHPATPVKEVRHNKLSSGLGEESKKK